ncbi:MAG: twin-arginine translocase subunit TatC [Betaproteobacteria bacterium]|nr:twin-arginine translocase subunit TatC [Betaproteobacteria bacterium]
MSGQDTFISHLVELRQRLVRSLAAVLIVLLAILPWAPELYDLIAYPMMRALPEGTKMIATGVVTPFLVPMKVAIAVAFLIALPYVLYQVWAFVAPGLYAHEKKLALPLVIVTYVLFLIGMAFCYFFVFGTVFQFVYKIAPKSISVAPDIDNYLSFVLGMFLAFGVTFEVPVVVVLLVKFGVVSIDKLKAVRSYVIVGAFVVAAVVTPPDVVSQLLLAIPMCLLYEVGLLFARFVEKQKPVEAVDDFKPLDETQMTSELDKAERGER